MMNSSKRWFQKQNRQDSLMPLTNGVRLGKDWHEMAVSNRTTIRATPSHDRRSGARRIVNKIMPDKLMGTTAGLWQVWLLYDGPIITADRMDMSRNVGGPRASMNEEQTNRRKNMSRKRVVMANSVQRRKKKSTKRRVVAIVFGMER
jgi:hypothetical protein